MRAPSLEIPSLTRPKLLESTLEALGCGGSMGALGTLDEVLLERAQAWIDEVAQKGRGKRPDARLLRVLVQRLSEQDDAGVRRAIVRRALERQRRVGWRHLWLLWEHAPEARQEVSGPLAEMVSEAAERRPRLRASLPRWLGEGEARMASALAQPVRFIIGWVLKERVALGEVVGQLGCSPGSQVGREIMRELASRSPADWWSQRTLEEKFRWAERGGLPLLQAVAERELHALGARAGGRARIREVAQGDALRTWLDGALGTPTTRPGAWGGMSRRARDVREWLGEGRR